MKALHDRFWTVRGGQNINVADRLHAAAVASGHFELLDGAALAEIFDEGTHQLVGVQEFEALGPFCQILNRLPDLFDTLLAESGQSLHLARIDPLLKFLNGADAQFLVELFRSFGPQSLDFEKLVQGGGKFFSQLLQGLKSAGFDYLRDVLGHTLADPRQFEFLEVFAFLEELSDRLGEAFNGPRGVSVSQNAE